MIKCSCLAYFRGNRILLVKSRSNTVWYLPGGKIELNEGPKDTLIRELREELTIDVNSEDLVYLTELNSLNHDLTDFVNIQVYKLNADYNYKIGSEISDCKWFDMDVYDDIAPAVIELFKRVKNDI